MKDEDCTIHTTQLFRNRRELDPFLKNVFPAGFCKHKHSETMPVRGKLEVSVPRVSPVGDYRRDFISIFNQKQRPCDEMTDVSGSYVDVRDEYADVAGPFFSDINRGSATVPGKHSTTFKRHVKSSNKDKGVKLSETVYQPTAVFPSLHARPVLSSASPRRDRRIKQATTSSKHYMHRPPPDGFILRVRSYDDCVL